MTPLPFRLTEDMQVHHFSPCTQYAYLQQVSLFARHFGQSPESSQGTLLNNRNSGTADPSYSSNSTTSPILPSYSRSIRVTTPI